MRSLHADSTSIPITIIGGYLGAGKTTLINRVLGQAVDVQGLAVLVNDFGDVNIDADLIRSQSPDGQIIGLSNGCVCCSIRDDFTQSLETLRDFDVDHILLEASGVALPAKLQRQCHYPGYQPRGCFVLIDAEQHDEQRHNKFVGNLVKQQVSEADVLVIAKKDLNPEFSPLAISTTRFDVDDTDLLELLVNPSLALPSGAQEYAAAASGFATYTLSQRKPVSRARLTTLLKGLPSYVQRVKGFVRTESGVILIQKVGKRCDLSPATRQPALQLVFIASDEADCQWLATLLDAWPEWSRAEITD